MEFVKEFNRKKTPEQQQEESAKLRQKHPDRVPIIVDRCHKTDPSLDKNKYLVPTDLTVGQFVMVIRKRLTTKLGPEKAMFFFVGNTLLPVSSLISQVYKSHAKNGYLTITYGLESTFGEGTAPQ